MAPTASSPGPGPGHRLPQASPLGGVTEPAVGARCPKLARPVQPVASGSVSFPLTGPSPRAVGEMKAKGLVCNERSVNASHGLSKGFGSWNSLLVLRGSCCDGAKVSGRRWLGCCPTLHTGWVPGASRACEEQLYLLLGASSRMETDISGQQEP